MDFESVRDGERLSVGVKDAGAAEIFPQTLKHNSNGRFVVACGDGEYIIYTAMALRNKVYFVFHFCFMFTKFYRLLALQSNLYGVTMHLNTLSVKVLQL